MKSSNFLVVLVAVTSQLLHLCKAESIEWLNIYDNDILSEKLVPAGNEVYAQRFYVCRAWHNNHFRTGKFSNVNGYDVWCSVPYGGREHKYSKGNGRVEVLVAPPGWTTWVPIQDRYTPPRNALPGGTTDRGEPEYICRFVQDDRLVPGKYDKTDGKCFIPLYNEKVATENFEVLVVSQLGVILQNLQTLNSTEF